MNNFDRKKHWENIYHTKQLNEVSWYQQVPETSLNFIEEFQVPFTANIIDIGGGDSFLIDHLIDLGYQNLTVLDISSKALDRAKERLGERASGVKWIVADIADYKPTEIYDFWHDRAVFHFLTEENDIDNYIEIANNSINTSGILTIGTFSEKGPKKCSGIEITQYSEASMANKFKTHFNKVKCITLDHKTPFDTYQNFMFCSFNKKETT